MIVESEFSHCYISWVSNSVKVPGNSILYITEDKIWSSELDVEFRHILYFMNEGAVVFAERAVPK